MELSQKCQELSKKYSTLEGDYSDITRKNEKLEQQWDADQKVIAGKDKDIAQLQAIIETLNGKREDYIY